MTTIIKTKTKYGDISFYCPEGKMPEKRAKTLLVKEKDTIEWIDSFNKKDIFWDIGANVGCYSLYAGSKGIRTYSFEPESWNYRLLNKNIQINNLDNKILAFCIAFNNITKIDFFNLSSLVPAYSLHCFGEETDWKGRLFKPKFKQGMIGYSIDDFIENFDIRFPNHIKIDVDGIEHKIINGALKTLSHPKLKSILVEYLYSNKDQRDIEKIMANKGFKYHSRTKKLSGKFPAIGNHIFRRDI